MARSSEQSYTATEVFHHPDGVVLAGESVVLSKQAAARGVERGVLVPTQQSTDESVALSDQPENEE